MVSFRHILFIAFLALCLSIPGPGAGLWARSHDFTVVIDAGHGEHDAGALGQSTNEKTINLNVALKLGKMLEKQKGFKVIYTRKTDRFVTLQGRCDIANKSGGDLFVSIHTNSLDKKSPKRTTIKGASVYTLGLQRSDENLAVAMRENSVMKLESDYSTTYSGFDPTSSESYIIFELSQNKHMEQSINVANMIQKELVKSGRADRGVRQANFWVLLKTAMPSILVELDFISNPTIERYLASQKGQHELAAAICRGICNYTGTKNVVIEKEIFNDSHEISDKKDISTEADPKKDRSDASATAVTTPAGNGKIIYKIQFLTDSRVLPAKDKAFKGLSPVSHYRDGKTVKYTFGSYASQKEASRDLKNVRRKFPDAFVIATDGSKRIK